MMHVMTSASTRVLRGGVGLPCHGVRGAGDCSREEKSAVWRPEPPLPVRNPTDQIAFDGPGPALEAPPKGAVELEEPNAELEAVVILRAGDLERLVVALVDRTIADRIEA